MNDDRTSLPPARESRPRSPRFAVIAAGVLALAVGLSAPQEQDRAAPQEPPEESREAAPPVVIRDLETVYAETPVTRAIDRGLEYLRSTQSPDGSWISPGYGRNTGITSLVGMAFLSRGHEPGRGPHGELLDRTIAWILAQDRGGLVARDVSHGEMYSHGIATLFLGEVLGMVDDEKPELASIHRVHRRAVDIILRAQSVPKDRWSFGGWRYTPTTEDSDISVSGWQLLALRAARDAGLPVPRKSIDQAVLYVVRCAHPSGGFSYQPGSDPTIGRTGTGVLALEICGEHGSPEAERGGDWLLAHPLVWRGQFFYYGAYYAAQAMFQLGGTRWERWRPISEELLLSKQRDDGSWPLPPGATHEEQAGTAYTTAMAILSLGVELRFLPIYQR